MPKVVCSGYLTKSPTSGGRGRWRLRWVELVDCRSEGGSLKVEYFSSEKKKNNPLGIVLLDYCIGIRELRSSTNNRYTSAFSFLFSNRSDLILSSFSEKDIRRWMSNVKKCGIQILVSISSANTLTRSISEADITGAVKTESPSKQEGAKWSNRQLPALPFKQKHENPSNKPENTNLYAVVLDEDPYKQAAESPYYSRAQFTVSPAKEKAPQVKRLSQPVDRPNSSQLSTLLVEPAPNLLALRTQLRNSSYVHLIKAEKVKTSSPPFASGAFGSNISEATLEDGSVVVRELSLDCTEEEEIIFLREAFIISQFNHSNVLKLLGVVLTGQKMMVFKLSSVMSLKEHLVVRYQRGKLVQEDLVRYSREVALGMRHMHTMGHIHKRLRAEHILMSSDDSCKVAGVCESRESEKINTSSNEKLNANSSEIWMAIEVLRKQQYTYQSDIWSFGILLYEIWSVGNLPYQGFTLKKLLEYLNRFQCQFPSPGCPKALYRIMLQCWYHKPSNRPTWSDILDTLEFPDMKNVPTVNDSGTKLPPESLKLGSLNLTSAKHLYKNLQIEYTEVHTKQLSEVLNKVKEGARAMPSKKKGLASFTSRLFSRRGNGKQLSEAAPAILEEIVVERNAAYNKTKSLSTDNILTEVDTVYSNPLPQHCSSDDLSESGYVATTPPFSFTENVFCGPPPKLKTSRSCESLCLYESIDSSFVSGHWVPTLRERKMNFLSKSKSVSATQEPVVETPVITSTPVSHLVNQFESLSPADQTRSSTVSSSEMDRIKVNSSLTNHRPMSASLAEARLSACYSPSTSSVLSGFDSPRLTSDSEGHVQSPLLIVKSYERNTKSLSLDAGESSGYESVSGYEEFPVRETKSLSTASDIPGSPLVGTSVERLKSKSFDWDGSYEFISGYERVSGYEQVPTEKTLRSFLTKSSSPSTTITQNTSSL